MASSAGAVALSHDVPSMRLLPPPELRMTSAGGTSLPSFPRYALSLLRSGRVTLSPANRSLLRHALAADFRGAHTRTRHCMHLLYTKCLYVRIRQEERRREELTEDEEKTDEEEGPLGIANARPLLPITTEADSTTVLASASSSTMIAPPRPPPAVVMRSFSNVAPEGDELNAEELAARLQSMALTTHSRSHSANISRSGLNSSLAALVPERTPSVASSVGSSSNGSSISLLRSRSATAQSGLAYPFDRFFEAYAAFADAAMRGYCSVYWTRQELFLRANQQQSTLTRPPPTPPCGPSSATSNESMMTHQAALCSTLRAPETHQRPEAVAAEHANEELETLELLRADRDLDHYAVDWPALLMLTHDAYQQHMSTRQAELLHNQDPDAEESSAAPIVVRPLQPVALVPSSSPLVDESLANLPFSSPSASATPSSFASASPPAVTGTLHTSSSPVVCDVVLHALQRWREQKAEQRRQERASMTPEQLAAADEEICYVPLAIDDDDLQLTSKPVPKNAAAQRWQTLRCDVHRSRLLKLLRTQREFYLALAKHKVLTYRPPPVATAPHAHRSVSMTTSPFSTAFSGPDPIHQSASMPNMARDYFFNMDNNGALTIEVDSAGASGENTPNSTAIPRTRRPLSPILSPMLRSTSQLSDSADVEDASNEPSESPRHAPPRRPVCVFLAGGMSSGKSTVLASLRARGELFGAGSDAVLVESDAFKLVDPVYQALPATDPRRSNFVHPQSLVTAEETLLAAVRKRRDVIVDGTMSWRPYVEQSVRMVRESHLKAFKRGRGYVVNETNGVCSEEYWIEDPGSLCAVLDPTPPAYVICMVGVSAHWSVCVSRAIRRAVSSGRSVPLDALLSSHAKFASNFAAHSSLVDAFALLDNSDLGKRTLAKSVARPTLVMSKSPGDSTPVVHHPLLYAAFVQQQRWPTVALDAQDMEQQLQQLDAQGDVSIQAPLDPSARPPSSSLQSTLSHLLPSSFRWLLAQVGGDDDVITEDEASPH